MTDLIASLEVNGRRYSGWTRVSIRRGIEQLAGAFDFEAADVWAVTSRRRPLQPGADVRVRIGEHVVIDGYIDDVQQRYSAGDHSLSCSGRDRSGDLVDCSAAVDGQSWLGRTLSQIAADLCEPFGIKVSVQGAEGAPFGAQAISPGETVQDVLARAAQLRGLLLLADGAGGLRLVRAGATRANTVLELGINLLSGTRSDSQADRYARYRVIGQSADNSNQQVKAESLDPAIRRARVTTIAVSDDLTTAVAQQYADWTRSQRIARGTRAELLVQGWLDGPLPWQPNTLVQVRDPMLDLSGDYLIAEVAHSLDDREGKITALTVVPADAYALPPEAVTLGLAS